jgi:hypothetical protein
MTASPQIRHPKLENRNSKFRLENSQGEMLRFALHRMVQGLAQCDMAGGFRHQGTMLQKRC